MTGSSVPGLTGTIGNAFQIFAKVSTDDESRKRLSLIFSLFDSLTGECVRQRR